MQGQRNVLIGIHNDYIVNIPFAKAIKKDKPIDVDPKTGAKSYKFVNLDMEEYNSLS